MRPGRKTKAQIMAQANQTTLPLHETPEFKAAVAEAVAKAAPDIIKATLAQIGKDGAVPAAPGSDDITARFFSQMALSIAEISDQGTSRKRVAPEILQRRAEAHKRCEDLLADMRRNLAAARQASDNDRIEAWSPRYRITAKVYLGERLLDPWRRGPDKKMVAQEITWTGWPSEAMKPLNQVAADIWTAYKESIGSTERLGIVKHPGAVGVIAAQDTRAFWVTPAGRVVQGDGPELLRVEGDDVPVPEVNGGPAIHDNNDPNAAELHVLGTIAAPARRNFADLGTVTPR